MKQTVLSDYFFSTMQRTLVFLVLSVSVAVFGQDSSFSINSTTPLTSYTFTTNPQVSQLIFYLQGNPVTSSSIYVQLITPFNSTLVLPSPSMSDYQTLQQFICPNQVEPSSVYELNVYKAFSSSETTFSLEIEQSTESYELTIGGSSISDDLCCGSSTRFYHIDTSDSFIVQLTTGSELSYEGQLSVRASDCPTSTVYDSYTFVSGDETVTLTVDNEDGVDYWIAVQSNTFQKDSWSYQIQVCPSTGCPQNGGTSTGSGTGTGTGDLHNDPNGATSLLPFYSMSVIFVHAFSWLV